MKPKAIYRPRPVAGFSLIELMIALVLGTLVVGAAGAIFLSNKRAFGSTESLGRIQENARVAFELMARDIREAGGTPCGKNIPIANVLKDQTNSNYIWGSGVVGFDGSTAANAVAFGTAAGQRVAGTDAIEFKSALGGGVTVSKHVPASATIFLNRNDHGFKDNDILLICDYAQASIFQVTGPTNPEDHVVHNTGNAGTIGNLCKALSFPVDPNCSAKPKDGKQYGNNSIVAKMGTTTWYIGYNGRAGGKSLYRKILNDAAQEVTEGVESMSLKYLVPGQSEYKTAFAATDATSWGNLNAVSIDIGLQSVEGAERGGYIKGTDGANLKRSLSHVVTLRNRMP